MNALMRRRRLLITLLFTVLIVIALAGMLVRGAGRVTRVAVRRPALRPA